MGDDRWGSKERIYALPRKVWGVAGSSGDSGELRNLEDDDARGQAMV
jgi:hypothetical protein